MVLSRKQQKRRDPTTSLNTMLSPSARATSADKVHPSEELLLVHSPLRHPHQLEANLNGHGRLLALWAQLPLHCPVSPMQRFCVILACIILFLRATLCGFSPIYPCGIYQSLDRYSILDYTSRTIFHSHRSRIRYVQTLMVQVPSSVLGVSVVR